MYSTKWLTVESRPWLGSKWYDVAIRPAESGMLPVCHQLKNIGMTTRCVYSCWLPILYHKRSVGSSGVIHISVNDMLIIVRAAIYALFWKDLWVLCALYKIQNDNHNIWAVMHMIAITDQMAVIWRNKLRSGERDEVTISLLLSFPVWDTITTGGQCRIVWKEDTTICEWFSYCTYEHYES